MSRDKEGEIRESFQHALAVRTLGPEPRALADRHFFETLVRVHREGEGALLLNASSTASHAEHGKPAQHAH